MTKIASYFITLVLICAALMGCNAKDAPSESDAILSPTETSTTSFPSTEEISSEPIETEADSTTDFETDIETNPGTESEESTSDLSTTDDPSHLIWTVGFSPYISNEARAEINRFLHEKGIGCEIEFVDVEGGAVYRKWYEQQKQNNTVPDILAVAPWEKGIYGSADFIKSELLPLNEYLDTEEGNSLLKSYCDIEWRQITIDGNIYTTPKRMLTRPYDLYVYVNDRYKDSFEASFDGSYESLRQICEERGENKAVIASYSIGIPLICAFLGCSYQNYLFYDMGSESCVNLYGDNEVKELLQELYSDMKTGHFVSWASSDILSEDVVAYITVDQPDASYEGYTQYVLSPYVFSINAGAFGVCAFSSKQELALKVLAECFSDPTIASLIGYGEVNIEKWNDETEIIKAHRLDKITGFIPELSKEEIEKLNRLYLEINELCARMITSRDSVSGIGIVNPNFPDILESYSADLEDNSEIYDKINQQLEEWTKDHDN